MDWSSILGDQLNWHWANQLRPRLGHLSDAEYFWEPVPGCWTLRQNTEGRYALDLIRPEPKPPPVTTIAWRLCHIIGSVLSARNAAYFGGPAFDAATFMYPGTAGEALAMLDERIATWRAGVASLDESGLAGAAHERFGPAPMAALILHIHREVIHHGAEIALLRDLYRSTGQGRGALAPTG